MGNQTKTDCLEPPPGEVNPREVLNSITGV
jgi:hypothetical protein